MRGTSKAIASNQATVNRNLISVVQRHRETAFLRPVSGHSESAFEALRQRIEAHRGPWILDSGCGTGASTRTIARAFPEHLVVGIDKSEIRLGRYETADNPRNVLLLRGDLIDIWRLASRELPPIDRHYLLYPNPWPKARHLRRRWHGHPVFRDFVRLGGILELRTNWVTYAREFCLALEQYGINVTPLPCERSSITTPFEQKYRDSGHELYRVVASIVQSEIIE